jgi:transcriptional regulator
VYIPKWFRETDQAALHDLMRANSFATLISQHDGAPYASHVPMLLQADAGPHGTLVGHMARANPQWRDFATLAEVLVLFQGPHTYVSPSWYEAALSVPTWNYAVVHAYGTPHLIEERDACYALLRRLVQTYEAGFERPWPFALPEEYVHGMMQGIVCFTIGITRLEGKFKLSQNRPMADRQRVVEALQASGDPEGGAVAALMQQRVLAT